MHRFAVGRDRVRNFIRREGGKKKKKKTRDKRVDEIGKHSEKVGVENRDRVENSNGEKKKQKKIGKSKSDERD